MTLTQHFAQKKLQTCHLAASSVDESPASSEQVALSDEDCQRVAKALDEQFSITGDSSKKHKLSQVVLCLFDWFQFHSIGLLPVVGSQFQFELTLPHPLL